MIVLDTNVLSELMKREADPRVVAWVDSIPPGQTAITALTVAEILYGIRRLPEGIRRLDCSPLLEPSSKRTFETESLSSTLQRRWSMPCLL